MELYKGLVNSQYFKEAAVDFKKNTGKYTRAPKGTREYTQYWDMQEKRCEMGHTVGGMWIPGRYYFYLNFTPIMKVSDDILFKDKKSFAEAMGGKNKVQEFPNFWEVQHDWWNYKFIAWNGGTYNGIVSPGSLNMSCVKTRQAGWSYQEAADGVFNYTFYDDSNSYYFASKDEFLTKDAILNKVQVDLDWLKLHTPWGKTRQKKSTIMHQKASYVELDGMENGTFSQIMGIIVDDPQKVRGKSGMKITFEEGGSFKNLKTALAVSLASTREGGYATGQTSVFGTGGEEGKSIEGLTDVFENPEAYDMLAFPAERYDEELEGQTCGYFVPCFMANSMFIDQQGNVDVDAAIKYDDEQRTKKAKLSDPRELDLRKAEYPRNAREALKRLSHNKFPTALIDQQIKFIKSNSKLQSFIRHGELLRLTGKGEEGKGEEKIKFDPDPKHPPVIEYPHKKTGDVDLTGCITIYEKPFKGEDGMVPDGIYQVVVDTFYNEDAEDVTSLYSVYVLKQPNPYDNSFTRLPVACYNGRPSELDHAHEQAVLLAEYYNAKIQSEVAGGGRDLVGYCKRKKKLHLLCYEIELVYNKEMERNQKNKSFFMNMAGETPALGLKYLTEWIVEVRGIDEDGKDVLTIHRIYDLGVLQEMRKFNDVNNFDRLSALRIGMFMLKENQLMEIEEEETQDKNSMFNRPLFADHSASSTAEYTTMY
jgi:hypothetical protein